MELRTEIQIPESSFKIDHHQKVYLTGSCFSENILDKFRYYGFEVLGNSHGIIYNPFSIHQSLYEIANAREYKKEDLEFFNGNYFSFNHHGSFSSVDANVVLQKINHNIITHKSFLEKASVVFVTLGTAWIYTITERSLIVANCHKIPSKTFEKDILSLPDLDRNIEAIIDQIHFLNPDSEIVFTISPVKHLKDGFVENQFSKSLLHVAIQNQLGDKVSYFPAYEIMNDDLRDYRFWKEDMVHPNDLAIQYIWEKFSKKYLDTSTLQIMDEVKKLRDFLNHRPLSNDQHRIDQLQHEKEKKKQELLKKYPQLKL